MTVIYQLQCKIACQCHFHTQYYNVVTIITNRNRPKFSECFTIYDYGAESSELTMNASEYPTFFDIHPVKMVDTCFINEDNIVNDNGLNLWFYLFIFYKFM